MGRHELLESLLAAQFELDYAEPGDLLRRITELNSLLDQAIAGSHLSRRDLVWALRDRYKEYKRSRLLAEAVWVPAL